MTKTFAILTENLQCLTLVFQLWLFHLPNFPVGESHSRGVEKIPCQAVQIHQEAIQHFQIVCRVALCPMSTSVHSSEDQLTKGATIGTRM